MNFFRVVLSLALVVMVSAIDYEAERPERMVIENGGIGSVSSGSAATSYDFFNGNDKCVCVAAPQPIIEPSASFKDGCVPTEDTADAKREVNIKRKYFVPRGGFGYPQYYY